MAYTPCQKSLKNFLLDIVPQCFLPAIQRELVWDTSRIENLFDSILRGYPIGTLLLWNVQEDALRAYCFYKLIEQFDAERPHNEKASFFGQTKCLGILDGQQRTTALLIGFKGSFREKARYKRRNNPDAWVTRRLYLNLLHAPNKEDEQRFDFQFLDEAKARQRDKTHFWLRAGEILNFKDANAVREWRHAEGYGDNNVFEDNLMAFWLATSSPAGINYFEEDNQDLNEVLTIFVRLNMGGQPLSYSDLLLSLATATWSSHDAREAVYDLVEKVNRDCGKPFSFDKNFILKALLVLNGQDVRFRTENIRKDRNLEQTWDRLAEVLPRAIRLVAQFGLTRETVTASNAIIPIAYYLDKAGHPESYLASKQSSEDRERIRRWLLTVLIGQVFGRQSDQILTALRKAIDNSSAGSGFPADEMLASLRQSQALAVSREAIEALVDEATYGSSLAYQLLALLRSGTVEAVSTYHVDHLHPQSQFTPANMITAGWSETQRKGAEDDRNRLPNLQLLEGGANQSKNDTPLSDWLKEMETRDVAAQKRALIPPSANLSFAAFPEFFSSRRQLLIDELCRFLFTQLGGHVDR